MRSEGHALQRQGVQTRDKFRRVIAAFLTDDPENTLGTDAVQSFVRCLQFVRPSLPFRLVTDSV
jgi:hypothetical protein